MARKNFISPKGEARWASVVNPTQFKDDDGKPTGDPFFCVDLVMNASDEECQAFMETIDEMVEESYQTALKNNPKLKKTIKKQFPYREETDEDGEPTGSIIFKFKTGVSFENKKTGEVVKRTVGIVDAQTQPIKNRKDLSIGNGSIIKVAYQPNNYFVKGTKLAGTSLYLQAVQILELLEYSKDYGFGAEEGGFSSSEVDVDDNGFNAENVETDVDDDDEDTDGDF